MRTVSTSILIRALHGALLLAVIFTGASCADMYPGALIHVRDPTPPKGMGTLVFRYSCNWENHRRDGTADPPPGDAVTRLRWDYQEAAHFSTGIVCTPQSHDVLVVQHRPPGRYEFTWSEWEFTWNDGIHIRYAGPISDAIFTNYTVQFDVAPGGITYIGDLRLYGVVTQGTEKEPWNRGFAARYEIVRGKDDEIVSALHDRFPGMPLPDIVTHLMHKASE